ncbi:hypothetical protein [Kaistia terrae]|uniref:Uncharacterized protein n=1 Tax=Kaistia terrae TaxID=537017 RepID=A0ABW0PTE7_9HYPH|nr:hypothetical protein [Kaistia terrae]MCX5578047.1 hypothetical protein [Kaistia terrae]
MSGFSADNLLAAAAVWVAIMLPSAAFGDDPVQSGVETQRCQAQEAQAQSQGVILQDGRIAAGSAT